MRLCNLGVFGYCFTLAIAIGLSGCADSSGENTNGNGSTAGQVPPAPPHECDEENVLPAGNVIFPSPGVLVDSADALFVWRASDADDPIVRTTLYISDQQAVFENPRFTRQIDSDSTASEHRTRVQLPLQSGPYFWGIEISDLCLIDSETQAVRSIRRPATGLGVPFDLRTADNNPPPQSALICPTESARQRTTFQWDLQFEGLRQIQVFVSRGGEPSPFDSPLRVFNVFDIASDEQQTPPTCYPMTEQDDPLPTNLELNWGVRIETGDRDVVNFSLTGLTGLTFTVEENEAPCGALLGPENETLLTQTTPLEWETTDDNCEDALTSTVFFEFLGATPAEAEPPQALFDSSIQCEVQPASDPCLINRGRGLSQLNFPACVVLGEIPTGVWAWGVEVDDGTDRTELPDSGTAEECVAARNQAQLADGDGGLTFRTFILAECQLDQDCDDEDVCNGAETCNSSFRCLAGTPLDCDDGDACNGAETCDSEAGCQSSAPLDCDDGDPCTADSCAAASGCMHSAISDAGTLDPGTIVSCARLGQSCFYDPCYSSDDSSNGLSSICGAPDTEWTLESSPPGSAVDIGVPTGLFSDYTISPAIEGDYVFRLTILSEGVFDEVTLTLSGPPNDECVDAIPISLGVIPFDTAAATTDGPSTGNSCGQVNHDIWYDFVAPEGFGATISTCNLAQYDTNIAVYDGCDCPVSDLRRVDCDNDDEGCACGTATLFFGTDPGNCYKIRIGGSKVGHTGPGTFNLTPGDVLGS